MKGQIKEMATEGAKEAKEVKMNEVEQLKAQVKELRDQIDRQPKTLDEKIQFFKTKEEQIKKLAVLESQADTLTAVMGEVAKVAEDDGFFTDNFSLKVTRKQGYSSEQDVLKVKNPKVIGEVLQFALDSITTKKNELLTLINS